MSELNNLSEVLRGIICIIMYIRMKILLLVVVVEKCKENLVKKF